MEKRIKTVLRRSKRVGRGYGSGKGGHTAGRGTKGQRARSKPGILFEGMKVKKSLLRRLPLRRGKGKFKAREKPIVVKLEYLNLLKEGSRVNVETLAKAGIINKEEGERVGVKILGGGELKKKLQLEVAASLSVTSKIEKAGGKIKK